MLTKALSWLFPLRTMLENLYAMRNIGERFFCKMKDMRKLTTRFEK